MDGGGGSETQTRSMRVSSPELKTNSLAESKTVLDDSSVEPVEDGVLVVWFLNSDRSQDRLSSYSRGSGRLSQGVVYVPGVRSRLGGSAKRSPGWSKSWAQYSIESLWKSIVGTREKF